VFASYDCDIGRDFFSLLFPDMKVQIRTISGDAYDGGTMAPVATPIFVKIYKPISTGCIFAHLLRTPMRESMQTKVFLAFPRFVTHLGFYGSGYFFDDGTLNAEETQAQSPLLQQPSFDRSICIHNSSLRGERTAATHLDNPGLLVKHTIESLLEILKLAVWSDGNSVYRTGDLSDGASSEADHHVPHVLVNLLSCHLPILVEHVSRRQEVLWHL
jgi:hypothetical protein